MKCLHDMTALELLISICRGKKFESVEDWFGLVYFCALFWFLLNVFQVPVPNERRWVEGGCMRHVFHVTGCQNVSSVGCIPKVLLT